MEVTLTDNINTLKDEWIRLWNNIGQSDPFSSFWWSFGWQSIFKEKNIKIFILKNDLKQAVGICPLKIENGEAHWLAGEEVTDYQDIICEEKYLKIFWKEIINKLIFNNTTILKLRNLPELSPTIKILEEVTGKNNIIFNTEIEDVVPQIILPSSFQKYLILLSRKNRHELRRKYQNFIKKYRFPKLIMSDQKSFTKDINIFISHFKQNSEGKNEFMTNQMSSFFMQNLSLLMDNKMLKMHNLIENNNLVAQSIGFVSNQKYYLYNIAINKYYYPYSPGFILNKLLIEEAIKNKYKIYDFLQGNEHYKYQLGAKDKHIYKITIRNK